MRSLDDPCGSWQVVQPSPPGACSQRYGPRLSAWQVVQVSAIESPRRSSFTLVVPCTLWQVEHCILPSRTGMCPERSSLATLSRWQVTQVPSSVVVRSWAFSDLKLWTLWQLTHDRFRESCALPSHSAWVWRL